MARSTMTSTSARVLARMRAHVHTYACMCVRVRLCARAFCLCTRLPRARSCSHRFAKIMDATSARVGATPAATSGSDQPAEKSRPLQESAERECCWWTDGGGNNRLCRISDANGCIVREGGPSDGWVFPSKSNRGPSVTWYASMASRSTPISCHLGSAICPLCCLCCLCCLVCPCYLLHFLHLLLHLLCLLCLSHLA